MVAFEGKLKPWSLSPSTGHGRRRATRRRDRAGRWLRHQCPLSCATRSALRGRVRAAPPARAGVGQREDRGSRHATEGPADHRGHLPLRHGRCQLLVRPAGQEPHRVRLAGPADRRAARTPADVRPARPRDARSARSRSGQKIFPRRRRGRGDRRSGVELPSILVRNLLGWEGNTEAVVAAWVWCRRHPGSVRRAFRSDARLGVLLGGAGRGARRARSGGRHATGTGSRGGGDALPDAVLGGPYRGGADAADRRAARHRGRAGRRSPPSSTRRCTRRRWC